MVNAEALSGSSRLRLVGYWILTGIISSELLVGGEWDLARTPYVFNVVSHLGYLVYLLTIIGAWKVLGGIALLSPGFPRLKEWAYAGTFFEMTGAAASHLLSHDNIANLVPTLVFACITLGSWALRPESRRL